MALLQEEDLGAGCVTPQISVAFFSKQGLLAQGFLSPSGATPHSSHPQPFDLALFLGADAKEEMRLSIKKENHILQSVADKKITGELESASSMGGDSE